MDGPFPLQENNIDPLAFMPRAEFKRFAKYYLKDRYDRNQRRHDLHLSNGKVEVGTETLLRQMGLNGSEPFPNIKTTGLSNTSPEDQEAVKQADAERAAQEEQAEQIRLEAELKRIKGMRWHVLRAYASELEVRFTPATKKKELIQLVLEKVIGKDAVERNQRSAQEA